MTEDRIRPYTLWTTSRKAKEFKRSLVDHIRSAGFSGGGFLSGNKFRREGVELEIKNSGPKTDVYVYVEESQTTPERLQETHSIIEGLVRTIDHQVEVYGPTVNKRNYTPLIEDQD